jgi:hypothetical protein
MILNGLESVDRLGQSEAVHQRAFLERSQFLTLFDLFTERMLHGLEGLDTLIDVADPGKVFHARQPGVFRAYSEGLEHFRRTLAWHGGFTLSVARTRGRRH